MRDYQLSFSAGEVDPGLWARGDMAFYDKGLSYAKNVVVKKTGGVVKRGGLEFVAECADSARASRLIPYDFGLGQTYVVELSHEKARFVRDGGLVGAPTVVTTPYQESELFDIGYAASGDVITLCHWNHEPKNLTRSSDTSWALSATSFVPSQAAPTNLSVAQSSGGTATRSSWFKVTAISDATGEESLPTAAAQESATAGNVTLTPSWTAATGAEKYRVYKDPKGTGSFGFIGETTATSFVDDGINPDEEDTPPTSRTPFASTGNYPEAVTYHQGRRWYASTQNDPTVLESSRSAFFSNFSRSEPLKATDAISASVTGRTVNRIRHLIPLRSLLILTTGGAWVFSGGDGVLTATSENSMEPQAERRGTSAIPPVVIGNAGVYVQRDGKTIRDIGYAFADDAYVGTELSAPSEHLFETRTIVDMSFAESPDNVIWLVLDDGTAVSLTYMRDHEVFGFCRHETDGEFESVAVVEEDAYSAAYFVVKRTIDGTTKRYIERLHERDRSAVKNGFYVDCGLTYSGTAATTISGLDHLEGEEVIALADGDVVRGLTVSGGAVVLPKAASLVHVGLEMEARLRSLPIMPNLSDGPSAAKVRRVSEVASRVYATPSFKVRGYPASETFSPEIAFTTVVPFQPENWGDDIRPDNALIRSPIHAEWNTEAIIEWVSDDPVHFELQTIYPKMEIGR